MKPSEFKELVKILHTSTAVGHRRGLMVESAPGIGKTQICAQAADELKVGFMSVHAPLMQPEDYGMPVVHGAKKDQLKFVVSADKFPIEGSECAEKGILLIDELSQADQSGQKILANLLQEREIHGHRLKDGWSIVCTGNRQADRAGANRILGHLSNRMTRVELEPSLDDWTQWALENEVPTELVAFIRFRPALLSDYNSKNEINATPRAWVEGVGARIGTLPKTMEHTVFAGDVGPGPAAEFMAFLKIFRNLPSPDAIFLNPKKVEVPKDASTQYAICGALVARVTDVNFGRALEYVKRLPPEFVVLFTRDAAIRYPKIQTCKDFILWAAKDGNALLS